jgi:hypothetical protein
MTTTKTEHASARPEHQVTGRDYPGEWARRIELYLDEEQRRLMFYGGLFWGFVLLLVICLVIAVIS